MTQKCPFGETPTTVALVIGQLHLGGGAERQLAELASGLRPHGFRPVVISLRAGPRDGSGSPENYWATVLRSRGVRVHEIPRLGDRDFRRLVPLIRILRQEDAVIVHSFLFPANAYARVATLLSGRRPILLISERTGRLPTGRVERLVDRCLEPFTDGIITNAEAIRRMLLERSTRVPIWVIPNGIAPIACDPARRAIARDALGLPPTSAVIGTAARMSAEKNYPFFVRLVRELRREVPDLRAVAIGDGPLRPTVEEEVRRAGLIDVLALPGRVDRVVDLLPALDVFVLVSDYEGLSNAIMEAQACGVPCVVTDVGGNREIVLEGRTGFLLQRLDLGLFASQIVLLLSDPDLRQRVGREARRHIATTFSLDRMITATAGVYRDFLRAHSRRDDEAARMAAGQPS